MSLPDVRERACRDHPGRSTPECLHFPIAWAETGEFGTLVIAQEAWRGLAYTYQAAGAPDGEPSTFLWLYRWNGRFFEPHQRIDPHKPTLLGSLGWTVWWAWLPSMYAVVLYYAVTSGSPPTSDSHFLGVFIPAMCCFWGFVHWLRWLGRRPE